jgi:hypothetical protein
VIARPTIAQHEGLDFDKSDVAAVVPGHPGVSRMDSLLYFAAGWRLGGLD